MAIRHRLENMFNLRHGHRRFLVYGLCVLPLFVWALWPNVLSDDPDAGADEVTMLLSPELNPLLSTQQHTTIDLVIPAHERDMYSLSRTVKTARKFVRGLRRVIVVSATRLLPQEEAEWAPESLFPFTKAQTSRAWVYQQLLKLYAPLVIPNISADVLIVDADLVWTRPVRFFDQQGRALYVTSDWTTGAAADDICDYFHFVSNVGGAAKPPLKKWRARDATAIAHHMLLQRDIVRALHLYVEKGNGGKSLWRVISEGTQHTWFRFLNSRPSEYELYFSFAMTFFPSRVRPRSLGFRISAGDCSWTEERDWKVTDISYVVCHHDATVGADYCVNSVNGCEDVPVETFPYQNHLPPEHSRSCHCFFNKCKTCDDAAPLTGPSAAFCTTSRMIEGLR